MSLNTTTFIDQIHATIAAAPDSERGAKLKRVLNTNIKKLQEAEVNGSQDEVLAILEEIQIIVQRVMRESEAGSATSPDQLPDGGMAPSDAPINPFTDNALDYIGWSADQFILRINTLDYFGFNKLRNIDGEMYPMPRAVDIQDAMTREKLAIIATFKRPLLIITPIGVRQNDLTQAIASQKGAMEIHNPPANWWNKDLKESQDFDHDIRGEMVYGAKEFDPDPLKHGGQTKQQLLDDPINKFKGWQVLVVEGADDLGNKNITANDTLTAEQQKGLIGLTPEDDLMLEAEGLRQRKPFESGNDWKWLTGAYIPSLDRVPVSGWYPDAARVGFSGNQPDYQVSVLGSRPAVRIL